jgi:hypothetical protein
MKFSVYVQAIKTGDEFESILVILLETGEVSAPISLQGKTGSVCS